MARATNIMTLASHLKSTCARVPRNYNPPSFGVISKTNFSTLISTTGTKTASNLPATSDLVEET